MKILVEHDGSGAIQSVSIQPNRAPDEIKFILKPQPGHQVTEVEAPDVKDEQDHERLREIKTHYQIEAHPGGHRLVHK